MLLKDFLFSFKNVHISFLEKKKILKLIRIGFSFLYKYFVLDLLFYNFFLKENLDKTSIEKKELFSKNLNFLFEHFDSLSKMHDYTSFYDQNFNEFKDKRIEILAIGTAKGGGLASFYFYFPKAKFIGIDNNPFRNRFISKRIRNIFVDISSTKILKNLSNYLNQKFDIIIEDCSHQLIDQILCFKENFKNLKDGGIYVVEDLNFPEISNIYNPTGEKISLKIILEKIKLNENVRSKYISDDDLNFIKKNIKSINFYVSKNKSKYLVDNTAEYSEIVFIKKK